MWLCLNNAFLSIVKDTKSDRLMVRARRKEDLEAFLPGADTIRTPERDYLYRTFVDREGLTQALAQAAERIDYPNFKNSVTDRQLHDLYAHVWGTMYARDERD